MSQWLTHRELNVPRLNTVQGRLFSVTRLVSKKKDEKARFSCVVSKKTASRAVDRNRAKRRCRAACTTLILHKKGAFSVLVKKAALSASFVEIQNELRRLVHEA